MGSHAAPLPGSSGESWRTRARLRVGPVAVPRPGADVLGSLALGALLAAIALGAGGGQQLSSATTVEIVLDLVAGVLGALAVLTTRGRMNGSGALAMFAVLAALTAVSIAWSLAPEDAWREANRTLSYLAAFGIGLVLVRVAPQRWESMIGATVVAAVAVSGYALLTKVFPGTFAHDEIYARLRAPFDYWNAAGLMGALGVPGCLWLGARRHGHAALNALAYPGLGVLLVAILLAYSRGSLLAVAVGCAFWFAVVPLRLRGVAVLAVSAAGAIPVAAWAFGQDPLTKDKTELAARASSGHQLGLALLYMMLVLLAAGLAVGFAAARRAPAPHMRRRAGVAVLVAVALVPVGLVVEMSLSARGLGGSISKGWHELTDPHARTPANDPSRLTAVGSVRARYWNESLKIFKERPVYGVGAMGYATARPRFREDAFEVRHAHGYLFQTLADFGLIGLAVNLLLLGAWAWAVARATVLDRRGWWRLPFGPERIGLLTLVSVVVVFGVHSFVDWTWFIPGTAIPALLCAAWVAGRGRPADPAAVVDPEAPPPAPEGWAGPGFRERVRAGLHTPARAAGAAALLVVAGACAWTAWQPLRSVNSADAAISSLASGHTDAARRQADRAHDIDPLAVEPFYDLAVIESSAGRRAAALAALEEAVHQQPQNRDTWLRLADFQLNVLGHPREALAALRPALYLDPHSPTGVTLFLDATRRISGATASAAPATGAAATPAPATTSPPAATPAPSTTPTP